MSHRLRKLIRAGLVVAGIVVLAQPERRGRKLVRSAGDRLARAARHWSGRWAGCRYRLAGRCPDPTVSDDVLADRIRSTVGPLERRLDVPRIHVTVEDHVALLHGDVGTMAEARQLEQAVWAVSGVVAVESYLHVGLLRSDTRPSEGRRDRPVSEARKRLVAAAVRAGVAEADAPAVVRAVLSRFAERIPPGERRHLFLHLPDDVRSLFDAPRTLGRPRRIRSLPDLVFVTMVSTPAGDRAAGPKALEAILAELQALVPEETADIAAVLPTELRQFWEAVSHDGSAARSG